MLYVKTLILPTSPWVILRGRPSEASGQELNGRVIIRLVRSLKVKRVTIAFKPIESNKFMLWKSQDIVTSRQNPIIKELFLTNDTYSGYSVWNPNENDTHEFPFSFAIPGHIHESVSTEFGQIGYELKVTIHTCGFGINTWTQSLPIPVYRVPKEGSSWDFALADSLRMRAEWLGAVELEVLSDSVSVTAKSKINVRAVIRPLQKNEMLVDIGLRLYERTKVKSSLDRFGDPIKSERLICQSHMRTDDPEGELNVLPLRHEYCFDLDLCIPQAFSDIQYDTDTSHLSIKHELVFTATVLDKSQNPHYLRISSPI
ncbi:aminopeptidase, partial [Coemansia sp. RSA 2607]